MEKDYEIKDSGDRTVFPSGGVRDMRVGKGMPCLIPVEAWLQVGEYIPKGLAGIPVDAWTRVAQHYEKGRIKYSDVGNWNIGDENWLKGIFLMCYFDSAIRHLNKFLLNWEDEDHLAAVIWNISCMMETNRRIRDGILSIDLDNRDVKTFTQQYLPMDDVENLTTMLDYWDFVVENLLRAKTNCLMVASMAKAIVGVLYMMELERKIKLGTEPKEKDDRDPTQFTPPTD